MQRIQTLSGRRAGKKSLSNGLCSSRLKCISSDQTFGWSVYSRTKKGFNRTYTKTVLNQRFVAIFFFTFQSRDCDSLQVKMTEAKRKKNIDIHFETLVKSLSIIRSQYIVAIARVRHEMKKENYNKNTIETDGKKAHSIDKSLNKIFNKYVCFTI